MFIKVKIVTVGELQYIALTEPLVDAIEQPQFVASNELSHLLTQLSNRNLLSQISHLLVQLSNLALSQHIIEQLALIPTEASEKRNKPNAA